MIDAISGRFPRFHLVLMVNHACNLACSYCYTGYKFQKPLPLPTGFKAIDRAMKSIAPAGLLELSFFGGEPLLDAGRVSQWMRYAKNTAVSEDRRVSLSLTTNGTVRGPEADEVLLNPDLDLAVSHDGLPEVHDTHRRDHRGNPTSEIVEETIGHLVQVGRDFRVVMVVRPDSVSHMTEGVLHLFQMGVRAVDLTLDVWTAWSESSLESLDRSLRKCAEVWKDNLRDLRINWFDEKLARLMPERMTSSARCGFGRGEIAVSPSGNLYPCERLIGEDSDSNPMRLSGHALEGENFLFDQGRGSGPHEDCASCLIQECCNTTCQCNNYIRTGNPKTPDRLLCTLNRICLEEVTRIFIREHASQEVATC